MHTCLHTCLHACPHAGLSVSNVLLAASILTIGAQSILKLVATSCDEEREYSAERGSIFNNFSAHADGERRGLDRIRAKRRKGLGEMRFFGCLQISTGPRHSPSACSEIFEKRALGRTTRSPSRFAAAACSSSATPSHDSA